MRGLAEIRDVNLSDFPAILALNAESVRFLSPLDAERLAKLHEQASYHRVIDSPAGIVAFMLAFADNAIYDSPNYGWFAARYHGFVYIDRIVVGVMARKQGFARMLYEDIWRHAERIGAATIACEIDVLPPNPESLAFHERLGFLEVGQQQVGAKRVSLRARPVRR
ncbi:MAG TPA: GNAT family N-acetyltransferase [Steroidobacteraceae bacterium]